MCVEVVVVVVPVPFADVVVVWVAVVVRVAVCVRVCVVVATAVCVTVTVVVVCVTGGVVGLVGVEEPPEPPEPPEEEFEALKGSAGDPWRVTELGGFPSSTASSLAVDGSPAGIFTVSGATGGVAGVVTLLRMIDAPIGTAKASSTRSTTAGRICRSRRSVSMPRISFMALWWWLRPWDRLGRWA